MADSIKRGRARRLVTVPDRGVYWEPRPAPPPRRVLDRAPACPRQALAAHVARKGESYASLSGLLGRGHGYLHRFVTAGVPRALSPRDHQVLADWFGVDQRELGVRDLWLVVDEAS